MYRLVAENLETFLAEVTERSDGAGLPAYVKEEFEAFLACGVISRGFSRVLCTNPECRFEHVVAHSCKGRGFCSSCIARRMADSAAYLEQMLPPVSYRQWTLTFPYALRVLLSSQPKRWSAVTTAVLKKLFAWQKRQARKAGSQTPLTGSITFLQRFNSILGLHPHNHALLPDGVFEKKPDGTLDFLVLPPPTTEDVARLLDQMVRKTFDVLGKDLPEPDDESQLVLTQVQSEALQTPQRSGGRLSEKERTAYQDGFSLHADTAIEKDKRPLLKKILRYSQRPPVATKRLIYTGPNEDVILKLRKPYYTGQTAFRFTPTELLRRLAAITPPPYQNLTVFHGIFSPAHKSRPALASLLPQPKPVPQDNTDATQDTQDTEDIEGTPVPPPYRQAWAELLKKSFGFDFLVCPRCASKMRVIASLTAPETIKTYLTGVGQWADPPECAPARAPPQMAFDEFGQDTGPAFTDADFSDT